MMLKVKLFRMLSIVVFTTVIFSYLNTAAATPYLFLFRSVTQPDPNSTLVSVNYMCAFNGTTGYFQLQVDSNTPQTIPAAYSGTVTFDAGPSAHTVTLIANELVGKSYYVTTTSTTINVTPPPVFSATYEYSYDELGRLIKVKDNKNTSSYSYDNANNRTNKTTTN